MNMTTVPSNQLKAMQQQLAAQELVIQQLRDALEKIACVGNGNTHGNSVGNCLAIEALAIPASTEHLEAWYMEMVGEVEEYLYTYTDDYGRIIQDISVDRQGREYTSVPLHAIKPFPFKEK